MEKSEDVLIVITPSFSPFFATLIDMFSAGSIDTFRNTCHIKNAHEKIVIMARSQSPMFHVDRDAMILLLTWPVRVWTTRAL